QRFLFLKKALQCETQSVLKYSALFSPNLLKNSSAPHLCCVVGCDTHGLWGPFIISSLHLLPFAAPLWI
uniref:Uncharacterized protein n=1 Tax=Cairina moschata TaxID=8855 RepID=A0A8C3BL13_CAIMO